MEVRGGKRSREGGQEVLMGVEGMMAEESWRKSGWTRPRCTVEVPVCVSIHAWERVLQETAFVAMVSPASPATDLCCSRLTTAWCLELLGTSSCPIAGPWEGTVLAYWEAVARKPSSHRAQVELL